MSTFTYATPTFMTEALHLVTQVYTAAFNDCYGELMTYTMLANSYWISFHDAYRCQRHAYS